MKAKICKLVIFVEETRSEMGKAIEPPTRRAAAVAVIENPFAGHYVEDLSELMEIGEELVICWRSVRSLRWDQGHAPKATAKLPPSAKTASSNTRLRFCIPSSGRRFARFLARVRADSFIEKTRWTGRPARCAARPQGRGVRAQPFRRHGSARRRRAPRQRDHGGGGGDQIRPAVIARGRLKERRDQGRRRASLGRQAASK